MGITYEIYAKESKTFIRMDNRSVFGRLEGPMYVKFSTFLKGVTSKQLIKLAKQVEKKVIDEELEEHYHLIFVDKAIAFAKKRPQDKFFLVREGGPTKPFSRKGMIQSKMKEELTDFQDKAENSEKYLTLKKAYDERLENAANLRSTTKSPAKGKKEIPSWLPWTVFAGILALIIVSKFLL
jgi:hypothetical protein